MTRPTTLARALLLTALALIGACGTDPTEPPALRLFATNSYRFGCGAWDPGVPPAEWTILDVPAQGTTRDSVAAATVAMGGWVVAIMNADRARIALPVDSVPSLYQRSWMNAHDMASTVGDTSDRIVEFGVLLYDSLTVADLAQATAVGATVTSVLANLHMYGARGDDSLVAYLRALPRVQSVSGTWTTFICGVTAPKATR